METLQRLYEMTALGEIFAHPESLLMLIIGGVLLYLGVAKKYEPLLLIPIGFGVILANIPLAGMGVVPQSAVTLSDGSLMNIPTIAKEHGIISMLYYMLIKTGLLPPIIFMGVGVLTDFAPMLRNLKLSLFGAAAQLGIFTVFLAAILVGFSSQEAGALSIIGGADGPTAIYTTIKLAPHLLGPIAIAAYSYMALVPIIIPMVTKVLCSKKELKINMKEQDKLYPAKVQIKNMQTLKILFPVVLGVIVIIVVPSSGILLGMLLFGNFIKEVGSSVARLSDAASNTILNTATIFLGLTIGATMTAEVFLKTDTLGIIFGGFLAFCLSVTGGILAVKIYNMFANKKINPLVGATGLSAVPMASRVANEMALKYDSKNHILQYCMASNIAGVIGSAVAAGVLISFLS
ncbi:MAG: sodium ion-translocating decarboxylase subunit beta [Bacteroidales bacterium]